MFSFTSASIASVLLLDVAMALDAPCYGYGNIFGSPSNYLEDDLDQVSEIKVGQDGVYVAFVEYLFEGSNHLSFTYRKIGDEDYRVRSW